MNGSNEEFFAGVRKWLEKQGYPLEMTVAKVFQEARFRVSSSDYYKDADTATLREIDVTATLLTNLSNEGRKSTFLQVSCCVECKLSLGKPWLLFTAQGNSEDFFLSHAICSDSLQALLIRREQLRRNLNHLPPFSLKPTAYGVTAAHSDNLDIPYKAMQGAYKASLHHLRELDSMSTSDEIHVGLVVPVIVIDGRLLQCSMASDGEIELEEVSSGTVHWKGGAYETNAPFIFVATKEGLHKFTKQLCDFADEFRYETHGVTQELISIVAETRLQRQMNKPGYTAQVIR